MYIYAYIVDAALLVTLHTSTNVKKSHTHLYTTPRNHLLCFRNLIEFVHCKLQGPLKTRLHTQDLASISHKIRFVPSRATKESSLCCEIAVLDAFLMTLARKTWKDRAEAVKWPTALTAAQSRLISYPSWQPWHCNAFQVLPPEICKLHQTPLSSVWICR